MTLSFKGHTVVVTGGGGALGKAYCLLFGSRGANVVVNDIDALAAQNVVDEIVQAGGKAVKNTASVTNGQAVISTALEAFGNITILINNAGILRDKGFKNMSDKEFDEIMDTHLKGAFACTKAAWPHFQKQKFGRVVNTASAAGLYGNFGQANYGAAKMGLVGFTKALAWEGPKYGISVTAIAPMAASAMTETVMPPEMLVNLKPEYVSPFVAAICHPDGPNANGRIFELGGGFIAELRYERSKGTIFKTDSSFTPSAIKAKWSEIVDFSNPEHPTRELDIKIAQNHLKLAEKMEPNTQSSPEVRYDGQTVIITGAGRGLGRAYALMYARLGANVVVNDIDEQNAKSVVEEITKAGGKAVTAVCSAEEGEKIVKVALDRFGAVHILVANAGIVLPKMFANMTEQQWDVIMAVHVRGTFKCAKAVWPIFQKQKYGRILTTSSPFGIYSEFGQSNYSTAKAAIIGLTRTLAIEGNKYNILVNTIAPVAGTALTGLTWSAEMVDEFKPDYIAPLVGYLTSSDNATTSGGLFEVCGCWSGQNRWQRSGGHSFPIKRGLTPEDISSKWEKLVDFDDGRATNPRSTQDTLEQVMANFTNDENEPKAKL